LFGGLFLVPLNLEKIPVSTLIFDSNNKEIGELLPRNSYRHLLASSDEIPQSLKTMLVSLEDKRFFEHKGIDRYGLGRAFTNNIKAGRVVEGGSTIESQLLRNLWWLDKPRSFLRKIAELYGASALAFRYSKDEILTRYINTVSLGHLNYGYRSGARRYFGKELAFLNDSELIALITLAKNPSQYDPNKHPDAFLKRYQMLCDFFSITGQQLDWNQDHQQKYPYLLDRVQQKHL
jgi:membrane peptidoglycan carboxypeptidase